MRFSWQTVSETPSIFGQQWPETNAKHRRTDSTQIQSEVAARESRATTSSAVLRNSLWTYAQKRKRGRHQDHAGGNDQSIGKQSAHGSYSTCTACHRASAACTSTRGLLRDFEGAGQHAGSRRCDRIALRSRPNRLSYRHEDQGHLGDLPRVEVAPDGTARATMTAPRINDASVLQGKALIRHAGGDTYSEPPRSAAAVRGSRPGS